MHGNPPTFRCASDWAIATRKVDFGFLPPILCRVDSVFFSFFFSDAPAVVPCDRANARDAVVEKACQDHQCVSQSSSSEHIVLNFAEHVFPLSAFFPILFSSARVVA